ncbi:hypothetical protein Tco_0193378 [Tanacetum coccineum]
MENQQKLLENLNQIWIGSYKLFASVARFEKKTPVQRTQSVNCGPRPYRVNNNGGYETQANGSRSYAATLKGKLDPNKENTTKVACFKKVTLHESNLLNIADSRCVVLVKVRDIHLILNINIMFRREGFSDYMCKYMGGLWLWVEFQTKDACLKFKEHAEMEWYFT